MEYLTLGKFDSFFIFIEFEVDCDYHSFLDKSTLKNELIIINEHHPHFNQAADNECHFRLGRHTVLEDVHKRFPSDPFPADPCMK